MYSDTIADMLTRIRNANKAKKAYVDIPSSKVKQKLAEILKTNGFIKDFQNQPSSNKQGILKVNLRYVSGRRRIIRGLKRISTPGLRVYATKDKLPRVFRGYGIAIMTTSKGIMTADEAKKQQIGGEVLCYVW